MAGLRAYHPHDFSPSSGDGNVLCLDPEESAHLVRSLRARVGEPIEAFDGCGNLWRGTVRDANPRALLMDVRETETVAPRLPGLALAQSLPKGGLMDDIVRAAVELDAAAIYPLQTARSEVHLDPARAAARQKRWLSIAIEACKQSGNPRLPKIFAPTPLKHWLAANAEAAASSLRLVGSLEADAVPLARLEDLPAARDMAGAQTRDSVGQPFLAVPPPAETGKYRAKRERFHACPTLGCDLPAASSVQQLLMLIGPEGDLSPEEYALARAHGFQPVRLGPHVLRVPTAAHYALVALDQLRQRMAFRLPL